MATELAPGVRITETALAQIVTTAAESVEGARVRRPKRHVELLVDAGSVRVELELAAAYGLPLRELGSAVQERVAAAIRSMCGLEPSSVDVTIDELA